MKKVNKYTSLYMSLGMLLGIPFGIAAFGILFGNVGIGICLGISLGLCLGLSVGASIDAKINKQVEEFGYTVKSVNQTADGYDVIVTDKNGSENALAISGKQQSAQKFAAGDRVYIDGTKVEKV